MNNSFQTDDGRSKQLKVASNSIKGAQVALGNYKTLQAWIQIALFQEKYIAIV